MELRLAAILVADVVGYSSLIEANEAGALARLDGFKAEVIDPLVGQHGGRIFKVTGDGYLIEFSSAVAALDCALEWQKAAESRAGLVGNEQAIRFRIGINLGDVTTSDGDLRGDGVNIAARLEALADPGTVLVSASVEQSARGKIAATFEDLGDRQLKNISMPVRTFCVIANTAEAEANPPSGGSRRRTPVVALAAIVTIAGIAVAVLWTEPWRQAGQPADGFVENLPAKPSIAVLPFANMSDDAEQEYFADGMTEDLITDLAKISGLFVISRNSVFTYKGKPVKIREAARDLGVRYILEGSVRKFGDSLRITGQLIDGSTGGHVWADNYDGTLEDVFRFQDEVRAKIVKSLSVVLTPNEAKLPGMAGTSNPQAYEAFLKGIVLIPGAQQFKIDPLMKAQEHFQTALKLDPRYGRAMAYLAWSDYLEWIYSNLTSFWELRDSLAMARRSLELQESAIAYVMLSKEHFRAKSYSNYGPGKEHEKAIEILERARSIEPGNADVLAELAHVRLFKGDIDLADELMREAIQLNPDYPIWYRRVTGMIHYFRGEFDAAADDFRLWRDAEPLPSDGTLWLAAAQARGGLTVAAKETLVQWHHRNPSYTTFGLRSYFVFGDDTLWPEFEKGLQAAGIPGLPE